MDDSITVPQHAVSPPAAHSAGTTPPPPHLRMLSSRLQWRNKYIYKQQTKKISPAQILPDDKRSAWTWGEHCWPQWQRGLHPVGDGFDIMFCPEDLDHRSQAKKRPCSCSLVWNEWLKQSHTEEEKKNKRKREESSEIRPPQQVRYGPDQGAPSSSSCTLSEPH